MKLFAAGLVLLLAVLQYKLWYESGGIAEVWRLKQAIAKQEQENKQLQQHNTAVAAEVNDLKQGQAAIEERARAELGMVKKGETFYQVIDKNNQ